MQPKVSIIVPVYNNEVYVIPCMKSLLAQTLQDIEIICINDGSTDSSSEILHAFADQDNRVVVVDKENGGYGVGINRGIELAQGEYIGILESDDFADLDMFETLYSYAKAFDLDVARSNFYLYWSKKIKKDTFLELFPEHECDRVIDPSIRKDQHCFYVQPALWSAIYKASFIRENKLRLLETPGAAYQDTAFNFKIWACAKRVMFIHKPFVHYRQDNEASSINNQSKIFNICLEYAEIDRWLTEDRPDLRQSLAPVKNKMMCDAYTWNTTRIARKFQLEFVKRYGEELAAAEKAGEVDPELFAPGQYALVHKTIDDPQAFINFIRTGKEFDLSLGKRVSRKISTMGQVWHQDGFGSVLDVVKNKIQGPEESSLVDRMDAEFVTRAKPVFLSQSEKPEAKISIVLPVYNTEKYLAETLDTILAQSFRDYELICVDDGSTDSSLEILNDYASRDSRIRVIHQDNFGAGVARNTGIAQASAPYLMILDSDDIYLPKMFTQLYEKAEDTGADIVVCSSLEYDGETYESSPADYALKIDLLPQSETFTVTEISDCLFEAFMGWPWDRIYRTSLIKDNGLQFPAISNSEDGVFVYSALVKADTIAIVDEPLIKHRSSRKGSVSNSRINNPECFYDAITLLKDYLKADTELYPKLEKSFLNWAVDYALWNIETLPKSKLRTSLGRKLVHGGYPELEIDEKGLDYFNLYENTKSQIRRMKRW